MFSNRLKFVCTWLALTELAVFVPSPSGHELLTDFNSFDILYSSHITVEMLSRGYLSSTLHIVFVPKLRFCCVCSRTQVLLKVSKTRNQIQKESHIFGSRIFAPRVSICKKKISAFHSSTKL